VAIEPGLTGKATLDVTAVDTAVVVGSGDVDVLATPRVVALCETATVKAVASALSPDETTVGTRVELDHLLPSQVGARVTAHARLVDVQGRRLTFEVEARDGANVVARGRVVRAVVDRARFSARQDVT
jgi:fluoroacetyl-CoA thioesterase